MSESKNVTTRVEGSKLIIEVDMSQNFGPSSSGKTDIIATAGSGVKITDQITVSMTVYKKRPK